MSIDNDGSRVQETFYAKLGGQKFNATDWQQFLEINGNATGTEDLVDHNPTEGQEQKLIKKEESSDFLQKVADKYNALVKSVTQAGGNPLSTVYRDFTFNGNWQDVGAVDYLVHRLSLIGTDGKISITPDDVKLILDRQKLDTSKQEVIDYAHACYRDFNQSAQQFGLPSVNFDPNLMLFLPKKRIRELRNKGPEDDFLAFTLYSSINEIIIPVDSDEFKQDPDALYDVIVHELGHQARRKAGVSGDSDDTFLEEGIVQSHTKAVAQENNRSSARSSGIYQVEVWIAENLARKFVIKSLIGTKQQDIKDRMREIYAHMGVPEPFTILEDDFYELNELFSELCKTDDQTPEFLKLKTQVSKKKKQMRELWGFT